MHLLVLGGNSEIGLSIAHAFARDKGASVVLASRNVEALDAKVRDIGLRYQVGATAVHFDALDYASHPAFYASLDPKPDAVVLAFGMLGDQKQAQADFTAARRIMETNYLGAASILELAAADMAAKGRGLIVAVSSVAGVRGRKSNYIYGSAKAGLTAYLSGLRHRLAGAGVRVVTVLPGFVRTKMTEGLDLPGSLVATSDEVAADVLAAVNKGRDTVYSKWFWRYIMLVIRHLPEFLFKRTNL